MSRDEERDEGVSVSIDRVCRQLSKLVEQVEKVSSALEDHVSAAQDDSAVYSMETSDPQEMQRCLKATEMALALREIVDGEWQDDMIRGGRADTLTTPEDPQVFDGAERTLTPVEAMQLYRDQIHEIVARRGIVLEDLL